MPRPSWTRLSDAELLQMRFCDLKLRFAGSKLERRLKKRLYHELERRGIGFRPHMWLAEEWFSPDGVPGIAVPFYLAHPRLLRLERQMMRQVEGGNSNWMMRILRHEAGHAIDTAWRLRHRARCREVFGPASLPYPERYQARPGSRRYVRHLGEWYAQSHPTEDFAETFAVWLKPNSDWRRSYAFWPARRKLQLMDELMEEVRTTAPRVRSRRFVEPLSENRRTLAEHYEEKLARRGYPRRCLADDLLRRVFTARLVRRDVPRASTWLRSCKPQLVDAAARDAGADRYAAHQMLRLAIGRAEALGLVLRRPQRQTLPHARRLLASMIRSYGQGKSPQMNL
ncbi:MAG: putative zinc-binding metallopeptidase [Steroidobacteraceae bacterium]